MTQPRPPLPAGLLEAAVGASDDALALVRGKDATIAWSNHAFDLLVDPTGDAPEGSLGAVLAPSERDPTMVGHRRLLQAIRQGRHWRGEVHLAASRGHRITDVRLSTVSWTSSWTAEEPWHLVSLRDVTRQRRAESRLVHLAHYDAVTGLPNRKLFQDRLNQALRRARRYGELVGLLFLDLDGFKAINDAHGHAMGDRVLRSVGQRLSRVVRDSDTVSRLAGDEFTVVLPSLAHPENAELVADKVLEECSRQLTLSGKDVSVTPSVGIAVFPEDGAEPDQLLERADAAMYLAKRGGRAQVVRWSARAEVARHRGPPLLADLERALEQGQLSLCYLPIFDATSGLVTGAEALLRWDHPERGPMSPREFLPAAEGTELELRLARWSLETAAAEAMDWPHAPRLVVNLAPALLSDPTLPGLLRQVLAEAGLPATRLELDLSEGPLSASDADLETLRDLGVRLAVDDFGTGDLPLSRLRSGDLHALKLDGSLVRATGTPGDALVRALVALAHSLGLDVMAEEVETAEQKAFLAALGCDRLQGYLLSRPLAAADLRALLAREE